MKYNGLIIDVIVASYKADDKEQRYKKKVSFEQSSKYVHGFQ